MDKLGCRNKHMYGNKDMGITGHKVIGMYEYKNVGTWGHVDMWTCGHVDMWTCGQRACLLLFYVLATSKVTSGHVPTCDSAHSWRLYIVAPQGN